MIIKKMTFSLPFPPSINNYYSRSYNGVYINKRGKDYTDLVLWTMRDKIGFSFGDSRISVKIDLYAPDKRRRDLDNILKCTLDVMQKLLIYKDDSQIDELMISRKSVLTKDGKLDIYIEEIIY